MTDTLRVGGTAALDATGAPLHRAGVSRGGIGATRSRISTAPVAPRCPGASRRP